MKIAVTVFNVLKVVLFLLFIQVSSNALAQRRSPSFRRLTTNEGLSQGHVAAILKDHKGFMWFGTDGGLNKYDGYKFTIYKNDPHKRTTLSNDIISDLLEDRAGNLWVATRSGLDRFDRSKEQFFHYMPGSNTAVNAVFEDSRNRIWAGTVDGLYNISSDGRSFTCYRHNKTDSNSLADNLIYKITEDTYGDLWIATSKGLSRFNPASRLFENYKNDPRNSNSIGSDQIMTVYKDSRGDIWAGTIGGGAARFDRSSNSFKTYKHDRKISNSIALNDIHSFCEDGKGNLWIGTDNGGISLLNYKTNTFIENYRNDLYNAGSLGNNSISSLYKDDQGTMWIGTFSEGVNFLPENGDKFIHYNQSLTDKKGLNDHNVLSIINDTLGLWLGTDGGGLNRFNKHTQTFTHFVNNPNNKNSINSNYVVSVIAVDKDLIGLGLYQGGFDLFNTRTNTFSHYMPVENDATSLSSSSVSILCKSNDNEIWIGTWGQGLNLYDRKKNTFTHYFHDTKNSNSIISNSINSLFKDSNGILWIGTDDGLDMFNEATGTFVHYRHSEAMKSSLSQNFIQYIFQDKARNLWIGTGGGLNLMDQKKGTFKTFTEQDGLANNTIVSILEDLHGNLWLGSNNGLTKFNPPTRAFRNYDASDGLQGKEFKPGSCFLAADGEMFFGGTNGFNAFYPDSLKDNTFVPPVYITDFQIFNKQVMRGGKGAPLQQQISEANEITLSYTQSVFSFEFSSLNYNLPEKNQYAYKLEGFDKDWNYSGNKRTATYTNLDPGKYVFHVKGSNNDGLWNEKSTSVTITILPPYWKTWWFKLGILFFITGGAATFYLFRINAVKDQKRRLEQKVSEQTAELLAVNQEERKARQEADEANRSKSVFLATMSHEIRTPMNGVMGMASLLLQTEQTEEQRNYTKTISTCGEGLLSVINGILDFSKIESGKMELENKLFHLPTCLQEAFDIFSYKASEAGLKLFYKIDDEVPENIVGDSLRLRQVLINLLGNAFKFTTHGEISVKVGLFKTPVGAPLKVCFEVRDTGIGIAADKIERLFKAFSQVDSSTTRQHGGTGLGLVICEKLVNLMGGDIRVDSTFGKGSKFTFSIQTEGERQDAKAFVSGQPSMHNEPADKKADEQKLTTDFSQQYPLRILVAEDNAINLLIIKKVLNKLGFKPEAAENGQQAVEMLQQQEFDLILMDVQMPVMDGLQATRTIRKSGGEQPVIIAMTANAMQGDREECLAAGMDDYLSKPINLTAVVAMLKKWSKQVRVN